MSARATSAVRVAHGLLLQPPMPAGMLIVAGAKATGAVFITVMVAMVVMMMVTMMMMMVMMMMMTRTMMMMMMMRMVMMMMMTMTGYHLVNRKQPHHQRQHQRTHN